MTSAALYDAAIEHFLTGTVDWERDTIKVLLTTPEYEPSQADDAFRGDIVASEVAPVGSYKPGGAVLGGRTVSRDGILGATRLLATQTVRWTGFTGEFRWAVVYHARGSRSEDELVAFTDLGDNRVENATVELVFDRDLGVCEFTVIRNGSTP